MIYTITLNPSLDIISEVDQLQRGYTHYSHEDSMSASGRAINISRILRTLDVPTLATGFLGGQIGAFIKEELDKSDIPNDFVHIEETTRVNISIFSEDTETRVLGQPPHISINEVNELLYYLSRIQEGDIIVMAGSLPQGLSSNIYDRIIEIAVVNKASFLPIIPAELIVSTLRQKPLLITPDLAGLSIMFDADIKTKEEALPYLLQCIDLGAQNVILNLRREGSVLVTADKKIYEAGGPKDSITSTTYTGLALVAGFLASYVKTNEALESFPMAQAAANATHHVKELPSKEDVYRELKSIEILPL